MHDSTGFPDADSSSIHHAPFDVQIGTFIDQHRSMLAASLDGLTDDEVRRKLVSSKTTLLGLVKHAAFVERVWFGEAVTGAARADLGIPMPWQLNSPGKRLLVSTAIPSSVGTVGDRCHCAGSSSTCSGNWRSTPATRTSCAN